MKKTFKVSFMFVCRWDMAKYPIKQSLKNLSEIIAKQVSRYFFCYFQVCLWKIFMVYLYFLGWSD
jgi:hypothetical protein